MKYHRACLIVIIVIGAISGCQKKMTVIKARLVEGPVLLKDVSAVTATPTNAEAQKHYSNGLASLIEDLGTEDFPRCRIGIGEPSDEEDVVDYVLGRFSEAERDLINPIIATAAEGVIFAIDHHFEEVMSTYNRNPAQPD